MVTWMSCPFWCFVVLDIEPRACVYATQVLHMWLVGTLPFWPHYFHLQLSSRRQGLRWGTD